MTFNEIAEKLKEFSINRTGTPPNQLVSWYITKEVQLEFFANSFTLIIKGVKINHIPHDKVVNNVKMVLQQLYRDALLEIEYNGVALKKLAKVRK